MGMGDGDGGGGGRDGGLREGWVRKCVGGFCVFPSPISYGSYHCSM